MSQWDPPPMPTPIVTPTPAVHQDVPVNSMLRPGMTQAAVSVASTQSAASVLQPVHVQAGFNGMNLGGGVGISAHQVGAVNNTQFQQPVAAATTTASAAATAQPVVQPIIESIPQVNSQSVTAFGEIIQRLMTCGSPAEKRQLTQISGNYDTLVSKVAANNVSADIMAKIDALVAAMNNRDFSTAKAIQSDLVSTAWTQHGSWVKGISGLLSILSKH
jgi:hypothetical protein